MPEEKKSFLEKNFPTLYNGKKEPTGKGRSLSISVTTKEARSLRGEEKKKKNKGIEVKDVSELKGYKPTVLKLPTANLLPYESKLRAQRRKLRLLFLIIVIASVGLSFSSRFFFEAQNSQLKAQFEQSEQQVAEQQAINDQYKPLQQYLAQISERNRISEEVNRTLPPYPQVLNSVESAAGATGVQLSGYKITSKAAKDVAENASQEGVLTGECGPINNPYERNEKPTLGCLEVSIVGNTQQALDYENFLRQYPLFTELYTAGSVNSTPSVPNSNNNSSRETQETPRGNLYTITAVIVSEETPPEEAPQQTEGAQQ